MVGYDITLHTQLKQRDITRINSYTKNWDAYLRKRFNKEDEDGEFNNYVNYSKRVIDIMTAFTAGKGVGIEVKSNYALQKYVNSVWRSRKRKLTIRNAVRTACITGDAYIVPYIIPLMQDGKGNVLKYKFKMIVYDPSVVYPTYSKTIENEMDKCEIVYSFAPFDENEEISRNQKEASHKEMIVKEEWTRTTFKRFINEDLVAESVNVLGYVPVVHVKNKEVARSNFGISNIEDIMDIDEELNAVINDIGEIVEYQAAPLVFVFGAKVKQLQAGPNNIYSGLPSDARVDLLELNSDLPAINTYMEHLMMFIRDVTGVGEIAFGKQGPMSNTTGVALHTLYLPILIDADERRDHLEEGLEKIVETIVLYSMYYDQFPRYILSEVNFLISEYNYTDPMKFIKDVITNVVMVQDKHLRFIISGLRLLNDISKTGGNPNVLKAMNWFDILKEGLNFSWISVLPKDELMILGNARDKFDLFLTTEEDELRNLGYENPAEKRSEIRRDALERAKLRAAVSQIEMSYTGEQGAPGGTEPVTPGEDLSKKPLDDTSEQKIQSAEGMKDSSDTSSGTVKQENEETTD